MYPPPCCQGAQGHVLRARAVHRAPAAEAARAVAFLGPPVGLPYAGGGAGALRSGGPLAVTRHGRLAAGTRRVFGEGGVGRFTGKVRLRNPCIWYVGMN